MTSDGLAAGSRAPLDMVDLAVMAGRSRPVRRWLIVVGSDVFEQPTPLRRGAE